MLLTLWGGAFAAPPAITSARHVDIFYDAEIPGDIQFAYRIVATGAPTAFDAVGLSADATVDRTTGWINGSRDLPGLHDVEIRATNADGTGAATVRLAVHPAITGVRSSQGVFRTGQRFTVTLRYNATVVVSGVPRLALALGRAGAPEFRDALYVSGSGTNELVFQYAVTAGDEDPDGVQLLPNAPAGGSIFDAHGLTGAPSLPVRHFVSGITIVAEAGAPAGLPAATQVSAAVATGRLGNVSARMHLVEGDATRALIAGFVISGANPKRVLLRAIGPALGNFGVQGALGDPRLRLYSGAGGLVADNDDWSGAETSAVAGAVGAFKLAEGTRDSAVVVTLPPGAYTLVVSPNGGDGVALAEVYDADVVAGADAAAIVNLSTRGRIDGGEGALIAGFAVKGNSARRVLIRGIGPGLATFGVAGALGDPTLRIFQDDRLIAQNDDWQTVAADASAAAMASGAFALAPGSKDAAVVLTLAPGAYTAVVSGAGNSSGAGLVEVYELPAAVQ